jgi:uracil-DNA glycosylase
MAHPRAALPDNRLHEPLDRQLDAVTSGWRATVERWRGSADGRRLQAFMAARRSEGADVVPGRVLRALQATAREHVRVVILGQDPYHGPGQAEGLAFSVPDAVPVPPSLRNIRVEVLRDLGRPMRSAASLSHWADHGVLLLNAVLTVELGRPASHAGKGWEALTDAIVEFLSAGERPIVFMLWGAYAQAKKGTIARTGAGRHLVLECNHPSPLSARRGDRPFVGCAHFSRAAGFIARMDPTAPPLDWTG